MIPLKDDNPTESRPIITYFLMGICIFVFFIELNSNSYKTGELFYSYGLIPSVLMGYNQLPADLYVVPAFITIFSSMFMHGGFMHLIGNMLYMWIFADNIEDALGPKKFLLFYLLSGIGAASAAATARSRRQRLVRACRGAHGPGSAAAQRGLRDPDGGSRRRRGGRNSLCHDRRAGAQQGVCQQWR